MSRVKYKVEFRGYGKDNSGYAGILNYLASKKCPNKDLIVRIDADSKTKRSQREDDLFFPKSLHIYDLNIKFHEKDSNEFDTAEFTVNYDDAFDICRLLELLASAGNPGHSYNVLMNNKEDIDIDGDGSDYLKSINGKEINDIIKNIYHFGNYWDFFSIQPPTKEQVTESKKDIYESVMESLKNRYSFLNESTGQENHTHEELVELGKKAINYNSIPDKYKIKDEFGNYSLMFDKMKDDEFEHIISEMSWIEKDDKGNNVQLGESLEGNLDMSGGIISYEIPLLSDSEIQLEVELKWKYEPYDSGDYYTPPSGGYGEITEMHIVDATVLFRYEDPISGEYVEKSRKIKRKSTLSALEDSFSSLIDEDSVIYDESYFEPDYPEWDD